jgi:hypothetical protein
MGSKYSSQSTSGYNSTPPSDDGATTEANKVKWSTIKTKLSDVLKTFGEAINSALVTTLNTSARAVSTSDAAADTDHWRTIQVNTASVTVTLADAATMAAGYIVDVANQSTGNITVALASSTDTIDTVTNTTATIPPKGLRRYLVNAAATGYITAVRSIDSVLTTEQATTSGTSIDFTGIPAWVKRITLQLAGVSTNGSSDLLVQLGDSGGAENTGYLGAASTVTDSTQGASNYTAGFGLHWTGATTSGSTLHGQVVLSLQDASDFTWVMSGNTSKSNAPQANCASGSKSLSTALDRIRLTTANGTDTFDAGVASILYE